MIRNVEIKRANAEDIKSFYPAGAPQSCYAWIIYYKGEPTCLCGFTVNRGGYVAFCDIKQNDAPKMTVWRAAKAAFKEMKAMGFPMMAIYCDPENQLVGQAFVKKLGFKYRTTRDGARVYEC